MATTKSGLTIHTIEPEHNGVRQTLTQEHSWLVRFTHWLNAISLVLMTMSGLQIYTAFPSFGVKVPQEDFFHAWRRYGDHRHTDFPAGAVAWQVKLLGGFGMIRIYHFAAMIGFLSFVPGHLLMVALHGWSNFYSMLIGWKRDPDYLTVHSSGRG